MRNRNAWLGFGVVAVLVAVFVYVVMPATSTAGGFPHDCGTAASPAARSADRTVRSDCADTLHGRAVAAGVLFGAGVTSFVVVYRRRARVG